jgi:hypothetical protein
MQVILLIIAVLLLSVIVYQDFTKRAISWFLIPMLLVVFIANGLLQINIEEFAWYSGINLFQIILNLLGVTLLISIKEKKLTNILNSHIGLGDILFFLLLATVFSPINFMVFYYGSILISLIVYGSIKLIDKSNQKPAPLAGLMSVMLVIVIIIEQSTSLIHFYDDFIFLI